jgi:NADH-quinone oxidoreductase subunit M
MTGIYNAMPVLGAIMWLAFLGGLGLPGMAGFIGEFTALSGAVKNPDTAVYGYISLLGIIITAGFILFAIQRVLLGRAPGLNEDSGDTHGESQGEHSDTVHAPSHSDHAPKKSIWPDLSALEVAAAAPLVILAIVLGLYPNVLTPWIDGSTQALLETIKTVTASR